MFCKNDTNVATKNFQIEFFVYVDNTNTITYNINDNNNKS